MKNIFKQILVAGIAATVSCNAQEVLSLRANVGEDAAKYLERIRCSAAAARENNEFVQIKAGGTQAGDDFAKAFIGFGESEEIDVWEVADPTKERVKMLRSLFDSAGGKAVKLVDSNGKSLDEISKEAPSRLEGKLPSSFLAAGTGRAYIVSPEGKITWERKGCGNIHKVQRVGDCVYYSNGDLYRCKLPGKKSELVYRAKNRVGAAVLGFEVQGNGNIVIALNSSDEVIELDGTGTKEIVRFKVDVKNAKGETPGAHGHIRMVHKTANGTYLVCCAGASCVREYDSKGKLVWEQYVSVLAFDALRLDNGNTLVSHITGITEFTPDHKEAWSFKCEELPALNLSCLCGIQKLANGNLVVGTWANGEPDASKATAFEITRDKKLVWAWFANGDRNMMTLQR